MKSIKPGVVFKELHLKNTLFFKDTAFQFKPGISVIYGLNRQGNPNSRNTNAAGKSFFFSQLGEICFDSPIVGEKSDRVRQGSRSITVNVGGKDLKIERSFKGKSEKVELFEDGRPKKVRTQGMAKDEFKRLLPITEDEFNTYVYLDSRVPHPLVMGTSAQRKKFFTDFFRLDDVDLRRRLFNAELNRMKQDRAAYRVHLAEYRELKSQLEGFDEYSVKKKLKIYTKKQSRLLDEYSQLNDIARLISFRDSMSENLKTLASLLPDGISQAAFDRLLEDTQSNLKENLKKLEQSEEHIDFLRKKSTYEDFISSLSEPSRRFLSKYKNDTESVVSEKYKIWRNTKSQIEDLQEELSNVKAKIKAIGEIEEVDRPERTRGDLETEGSKLMHQIEHAEKFGKGECPTCGQEVQIKDPEILNKKLTRIQKDVRLHLQADEAEEQALEHKALRKKIKAISAELESLEDKESTYRKYSKMFKELQGIPEEPEEFSGRVYDYKTIKQMVEEDESRLRILKFCDAHIDQIVECLKITKEDEQKLEDLKDMQDRMSSINKTIASCTARLEIAGTASERFNVVRSKMRELKKTLMDEEPLKILIDAYSEKAIKRLVIQSISNVLVKTINQYARLVFNENYTFEIKMDTQFSILVHRQYGKKSLPSDVRKLSGAESKLFTLVLVMSLLTFVPAYKRSNLLILDEPSANFGKETTEAFTRLLPVLNKRIPSIVIITPKTEDRYEGAHVYTVVKEKGVSRIVEGLPK